MFAIPFPRLRTTENKFKKKNYVIYMVTTVMIQRDIFES